MSDEQWLSTCDLLQEAADLVEERHELAEEQERLAEMETIRLMHEAPSRSPVTSREQEYRNALDAAHNAEEVAYVAARFGRIASFE